MHGSTASARQVAQAAAAFWWLWAPRRPAAEPRSTCSAASPAVSSAQCAVQHADPAVDRRPAGNANHRSAGAFGLVGERRRPSGRQSPRRWLRRAPTDRSNGAWRRYSRPARRGGRDGPRRYSARRRLGPASCRSGRADTRTAPERKFRPRPAVPGQGQAARNCPRSRPCGRLSAGYGRSARSWSDLPLVPVTVTQVAAGTARASNSISHRIFGIGRAGGGGDRVRCGKSVRNAGG